MNEAIEHAAQAAYQAGNPNATSVEWTKLPAAQQEWWRLVTTAALKSLRNPTRNMLLAADFIIRQESQQLTIKLHQAVIDKATDPKG